MPTDFGAIAGQLIDLFTDPMSNLGAALALYAIVAIVVLIVLIGGVMLVLGGSEDESASEAASEASDTTPDDSAGAGEPPVEYVAPPKVRRPWWFFVLVTVAVIAAVWAATGYSTSSDAVCEGCHEKSPHAAVDKARDPHAKADCIACHEPGGPVSRAVLGVPSRTLHIIGHLAGPKPSRDYGRVTRSACASCHSTDIAKTTTDPVRGVRMSHAEPLAAGATCLDCHKLQAGALSARGVGMNPCIRCHDSKTASAECSTCHDKKAANAARVRKVTPSEQIPDLRCGGCHDEKKECDSCHGVRLPHTKEFMVYAHARAGAVDLWFNNGQTCGKCHTPARNPCTKCHSTMLGSGHGPGNAVAHQKASASACESCHNGRAYTRGRDFCKDLCHSQAAIETSPR